MNATTAPKKTERSGRNINAWIDERLWDTFQRYLDSQEVRPSVTRVLEAALREFFSRRGF